MKHYLLPVLLLSSLCLAMDVKSHSGSEETASSGEQQFQFEIYMVSCERYCNSAVVKINWCGNGDILTKSADLSVRKVSQNGRPGELLQQSPIDNFLDGEKSFCPSAAWKWAALHEVEISITSKSITLASIKGIKLAKICPNIINVQDNKIDDTDRIFKAPNRPKYKTW